MSSDIITIYRMPKYIEGYQEYHKCVISNQKLVSNIKLYNRKVKYLIDW